MRSLFLSKVPVSEPLQGPLYRASVGRAACLQGLFYIFLKFHIKIPQNKEIPSVKEPRKGVSLHVPQKRGPYGN